MQRSKAFLDEKVLILILPEYEPPYGPFVPPLCAGPVQAPSFALMWRDGKKDSMAMRKGKKGGSR